MPDEKSHIDNLTSDTIKNMCRYGAAIMVNKKTGVPQACYVIHEHDSSDERFYYYDADSVRAHEAVKAWLVSPLLGK